MILANVTFDHDGAHYTDLCLVPYRLDGSAIPVRIGLLQQSRAAVYWIGPEEGVVVEEIPAENAKVIRPVPPASLFLTPPASSLPGFKVARVKIIQGENGEYQTHFARDQLSEWQPWDPLTMTR